MHPTTGRHRRLAPALVLVLGIAVTLLTANVIHDADRQIHEVNNQASAANLALVMQSLASGLEADLTATVNVALATAGDPDIYRARVADGTEGALVALLPDLGVVPSDAGPEGTTTEASVRALLDEPEVRRQIEDVADDGGFRFIVHADDDGSRTLLLAAGASDAERSYVEIRQFELAGAGPMIVDLVDGLDRFAVYTSPEPDPASSILASTSDLPLRGSVARTTVQVGNQELLIVASAPSAGSIPVPAVLGLGVVLSLALAGLLFQSQRRQDQAIQALEDARTANEARQAMEANLQRTQRMDTVGQLAGGVAHDFNNLLAAITSTVDLVEDAVDDPTALEDLDEIRNAARRGAALTRRLLSFSRRDVETRESLDLHDVIDDVSTLLRRAVPEDVTLRFDLTAGRRAVEGDAGEIEQVLLNLVVNARDAARDTGDAEIVVATRDRDDDVVLEVRDNGSGMAPDVVERACEPFFSTKSPTEGTGLGLAIVYGIASRMGGEVEIDSRPDEGTAVRVVLPALEVPGTSGRPAEEPPEPLLASSTERILLIEDEPTVRRATRRLLERVGHEVVDAGDAVEALAVVEDGFDPTVVLTDVVLPGFLNGRELAERIVEMVPDARVVFASGYSSEIIDRRQLLDQGAVFLAKPFTTESLLDAVSAAVEPVGSHP